jgi:hypothetical protein
VTTATDATTRAPVKERARRAAEPAARTTLNEGAPRSPAGHRPRSSAMARRRQLDAPPPEDRDYGAEIDELDSTDQEIEAALNEVVAEFTERLGRLDAELTELRAARSARPDRGLVERLKSRKFLLAVFGVPIASAANRFGVDQEIIISGIGLVIAYVLGESYVDSKVSEKGHEPGPAPQRTPPHKD